MSEILKSVAYSIEHWYIIEILLFLTGILLITMYSGIDDFFLRFVGTGILSFALLRSLKSKEK